MSMATNSFKQAVHDQLTSRSIDLRLQAKNAIVLERIARGGGATRWYSCSDKDSIPGLEAHLSPGSQVSFYFDGRIRRTSPAPGVAADMKRIVAETGDVVAGILASDGLRIEVQIISGPKEVDEFIAAASSLVDIFYGAFPGPDDDAANAITTVLPDADGVVRAHPY